MTPRTEAELLAAVIDLANHCRWAIHHDRPALRSGGRWHTAIEGHAGFPDLVLARNGVVLFRELKGYDARGRLGKLSSEQRDWAKQLDPPWQQDAYVLSARIRIPFDVWTPDDWVDVIVPTLTAKVGSYVGTTYAGGTDGALVWHLFSRSVR